MRTETSHIAYGMFLKITGFLETGGKSGFRDAVTVPDHGRMNPDAFAKMSARWYHDHKDVWVRNLAEESVGLRK